MARIINCDHKRRWDTGGAVVRVIRAEGAHGRSAKRRKGQRARRAMERAERSTRLEQRRVGMWEGRPWYPGKRTMVRAVRDLMFEALDPVAWISYAGLLAKLPAAVKPATIIGFLVRDCKAGRVERQAFTVPWVFEKKPALRRKYRYRLTRLGELYRARRQAMENPGGGAGVSQFSTMKAC